MPTEVAPGVYRVDGIRMVNAYLIVADEGVTAVDTGMPGMDRQVLASLEALGFAPGDLTRIVITHADPDHAGGAAALRSATGARLMIHAGDAPVLAGGPSAKSGNKLVATVLARLFTFTPADADQLLTDDDEVAGFRVIEVPGHTPGSIALLRDADGVLISGDALLSDRSGRVSQPRRAMSADWPTTQQSASALESLEFSVLLPGHGEPAHRS